jgi:Domain of unknown function (DUF1996)
MRSHSARRWAPIGVLVALLLLGALTACMAPTFDAGASDRQIASGAFGVVCTYSHRAPNDPIVHPNMPGMSHSHDFFGNSSTDAESTFYSLRAAETDCNRPADKSAYWMPTVFYNGTPVEPVKVQLYYNNDRRADVKALPPGLKIVAGNAMATGPQDTHIVAWQCSDNLGSQPSAAMPPQCPSGTTLKAIVRFPGCWNGTSLDSPDHKSHMAYALGTTHDGPCPSGYPVKVVTVNAEFKFPISDGSQVTLASGPAYTLHGDFFNGWDSATLQTLVSKCVAVGIKCSGTSTP